MHRYRRKTLEDTVRIAKADGEGETYVVVGDTAKRNGEPLKVDEQEATINITFKVF